MNNVNVALFSSHIKPFAAHRKMNVCDAVSARTRFYEKERQERKKGEIVLFVLSRSRQERCENKIEALQPTFPSGTSNNARRSEFSSDNSRSG